MADLTLSVTQGTPFGGQTITITGTGFEAIQGIGSVTFDGRLAVIGAWSDTSVTVTTPARMNNGFLVVGSDDVAVVLTTNGGATKTGIYHYNATRWDLILQWVRSSVAEISVQRGDYYTIGTDQVANLKRAQEDTGSEWPQVIVSGGEISYQGGESVGADTPYGFDTGRMTCIAQAMIPLGEVQDWDPSLRFLCADLYRAIRLARKNDSRGISIDVNRVYPDKFDGEQGGAFGVAVVEFDVTLKHTNTNMNTSTQGE